MQLQVLAITFICAVFAVRYHQVRCRLVAEGERATSEPGAETEVSRQASEQCRTLECTRNLKRVLRPQTIAPEKLLRLPVDPGIRSHDSILIAPRDAKHTPRSGSFSSVESAFTQRATEG